MGHLPAISSTEITSHPTWVIFYSTPQVRLHNKDITFLREKVIFHPFDDSRILSPFLTKFMDEKLKLKCDSSVLFSDHLFHYHFHKKPTKI